MFNSTHINDLYIVFGVTFLQYEILLISAYYCDVYECIMQNKIFMMLSAIYETAHTKHIGTFNTRLVSHV